MTNFMDIMMYIAAAVWVFAIIGFTYALLTILAITAKNVGIKVSKLVKEKYKKIVAQLT